MRSVNSTDKLWTRIPDEDKPSDTRGGCCWYYGWCWYWG